MSRGGATKPVRVHRNSLRSVSAAIAVFSPKSRSPLYGPPCLQTLGPSGERRRRDGRTRDRRRGTEPGAVLHPPSPCKRGSPTAAIAGEGPDHRIVVGGE